MNEKQKLSVCETVHSILKDSADSDDETKTNLILQSRNYIQQIMDGTIKGKLLDKFISAVDVFIKTISHNIALILKDENNSQIVSEVIMSFLTSKHKVHFLNDITLLVIAFLETNFQDLDGTLIITPIIAQYFQMEEFSESFEQNNGVSIIWDLFSCSEKYNILLFASETTHSYFQGKKEEDLVPFLSHVINSFHRINYDIAFIAFEFLSKIFRKQKINIFSQFISLSGFTSINNYILKSESNKYLELYRLFKVAGGPISASDAPYVVSSFVDLIISKDFKRELFSSSLAMTKDIINDQKHPLSVSNIEAIAKIIEIPQDLFTLVDIIIYQATALGFDPEPVFLPVAELFTPSFALQGDLSNFFYLSIMFWTTLSHHFIHFFSELIFKCKEDEFSRLLSGYPIMFKCISQVLGSDASLDVKHTILNEILINMERIADENQIEVIISESILNDGLRLKVINSLLETNDKELVNILFRSIQKSLSSSHIRKCLVEINFINIVRELLKKDTITIDIALSFCCSLANGAYNSTLDMLVHNFVLDIGLDKFDKAQLSNIVFSRNDYGSIRLIFPSLLAFCTDFSIENDFDSYIASKCALQSWLDQTRKEITEFPNINRLSQRFLLPEHVRLLFSYPKLFSECCNDINGLIPKFEYQQGRDGNSIEMKLDALSLSISFWVNFETYSTYKTLLLNLCNTSIVASNDEIYFGDSKLFRFQCNSWVNITVTSSERSKTIIYVNSKVSLTKACSYDPKIIFGSGVSHASWNIGGAIRVFNAILSEDECKHVYNSGVLCLNKLFPSEKFTISPNLFAYKLMSKYKNVTFGDSLCPVPSYPLALHIKNTYGGSKYLYRLILDKISANEFDEARCFVKALCYLQIINCSNWSKDVFALNISSLYHICHKVFNSEILNSVFQVFADDSDDTVHWESLSILILDPGFFNSSNAPLLISRIFGILARSQPQDQHLTDSIFLFIYFGICTLDLSEENMTMLRIILTKLSPSITAITSCILDSPNLTNSIKLHTERVCLSSVCPFYSELFDLLLQSFDASYNYQHIIRLLNPEDALSLIIKCIMPPNSGKIKMDKHFLMRFCLEYCYLKRSWSIAITLLTKSYFDIDTNETIECSNLDLNIMPDFLNMVSILHIASYNFDKDHTWNKLLDSIIHLLNNTRSQLSKRALSYKDIKFSLLNLLSCGLLRRTMTCFPYSPGTTDPNQILEHSLQEGQTFKVEKSIECPLPPFSMEKLLDTAEKQAMSAIRQILPDNINFLPPKSKSTIQKSCFNFSTSPYFVQNEPYIPYYDSWVVFLRNKLNNFIGNSYADTTSDGTTLDIDSNVIIESPKTQSLIYYVSYILFLFSSDEKLFKELVEELMLTHTLLDAELSLFTMRRVTYHLIAEFNQKKQFSSFFIQFVINRIYDGWFANDPLEIFGLILTNLVYSKNCLADKIFELFYTLFSILPKSQHERLCDIVHSNWNVVFCEENRNNRNYALIIGKIIEFEKKPAKFLSMFISDINNNDIFSQDWKIPECSKEFMLKLIDTSYTIEKDTFVNKYRVKIDVFECYLKEEHDNLFKTLTNYVKVQLDNVLELRSENSNKFFSYTDKCLQLLHIDIYTTQALYFSTKSFWREVLLFHFEFFLRIREVNLTEVYPFKAGQGDLRSLSILSNPLYPTIRMETSSVRYNLPKWPNGALNETKLETPESPMLMVLWPECIRNLLSISWKHYEILSLISSNHYNLTFSCSLDPNFIHTYVILQSIVCDTDQFDMTQNLMFMYGVEPIEGFLAKTKDSFIFLDGVHHHSFGLEFRDHSMNNLLLNFYISYFSCGHFGRHVLFNGHCLLKWRFSDIIYICKHLWMHKMTSIEVFTIYGWNFILIAESKFKQLYSVFSSVAEKTLQQVPPKSHIRSPINSVRLLSKSADDILKMWYENEIDNAKLLFCLNKLGARSYCDYSQFFVFPWILTQFNEDGSFITRRRDLTLPMGQIGEDRKVKYEQTYIESNNSHFYGTHYMHLGVVLYFMSRLDPFSLFGMFIHQGYDHPNRMFYDFNETWASAAYLSPADVKEMIPHIFFLPQMYEAMERIDMGTKSVVKIGAWAANTRDFVQTMFEALNDETTTTNLNEWIDLIFGYKSRGQAAIDSRNLFHPLCYPIDEVQNVDDSFSTEAIRTFAVSFGQCPIQLFKKPVQQKTKKDVTVHILSDPVNIFSQFLKPNARLPVTDIALSPDMSLLLSKGVSCIVPPLHKMVCYCYGESMSLYVSEYEKTQKLLQMTSNSKCLKESLLFPLSIKFSADGCFAIVSHYENYITLFRPRYKNNTIVEFRFIDSVPTKSEVLDMAVSTQHYLMLSSSLNFIECYDIGLRKQISPIVASFEVNRLIIDDNASLIIGGGEKIAVWDISGSLIIEKNMEYPVTAIQITALEENVPNRFFITGHRNGAVNFWKVDYKVNQIINLKSCQYVTTPVNCIYVDPRAQRVIFSSTTSVVELNSLGSDCKPLKPEFALECCECNSCDKLRSCSNCYRFVCESCSLEDSQTSSSDLRKKTLCSQCRVMMH